MIEQAGAEQDEQQAQKTVLQPRKDPVKDDIIGNGDASTTRTDSEQPKSPVEALDETTDRLNHVLALHTSRRMKNSSSSPEKEVKQGVSIPSQRRWLHYWCRLLENRGPPGFWSVETEHASRPPAPKVRLTQMQIRMYTLSGLKTSLVKTANAVMSTASLGTATKAATAAQSSGQIWASLARYDDDLVELLEKWELYTRGENEDMGRRRKGSEQMDGEALEDIFKDGKWDKGKMVRSFARLGAVEGDAIQKKEAQVRWLCLNTLCVS